MSAQTPPLRTLCLKFDEDDISQALRQPSDATQLPERMGAVALYCRLLDSDGTVISTFTVDAARSIETVDEFDRRSRCFFYLNGLLRALNMILVRHRDTRRLNVHTFSRYLADNAHRKRIGRWKKRGFKGMNGQRIALRPLWNMLFDFMTSAYGFREINVQLADKP